MVRLRRMIKKLRFLPADSGTERIISQNPPLSLIIEENFPVSTFSKENPMTLQQLRYIIAIVQAGSLNMAARALFISQPSLSHTIKVLETELGVPLFSRSGRNIVLTKYGEILLRHTNRIMQELHGAQKELADTKEAQKLTVTIYLFAASMIIPSFLTRFRQEHPDIRFEILQQHNKPGQQSQNHVDLFLSSSINPIENDHSVTLLKEDIMLAMPDTDPHARKSSVNLDEFEKAGFISLEAGASLRTITDFYCRMAGFIPHVVLESDSPMTVREFIRAGLGVSFAPRITWHGVGGDHVALVPIASPNCQRYISLSWKKGEKLSPPAEMLKKYIIDNFSDFAREYAGLPPER